MRKIRAVSEAGYAAEAKIYTNRVYLRVSDPTVRMAMKRMYKEKKVDVEDRAGWFIFTVEDKTMNKMSAQEKEAKLAQMTKILLERSKMKILKEE